MTFDLSRALHDAAERAPLGALEPHTLATRIRHRRTARAATRSVLGVGLAGAVVASAMHLADGSDGRPPLPVASAEPTSPPTRTATPTPTYTPTPAPTPTVTPPETATPAAWACGDPAPQTDPAADVVVGFPSDPRLMDGIWAEAHAEVGEPLHLDIGLFAQGSEPVDARVAGLTVIATHVDGGTFVSSAVPAPLDVAIPGEGAASVQVDLPLAECAGGTVGGIAPGPGFYDLVVAMNLTLGDGSSGVLTGELHLVVTDPTLPGGGLEATPAGSMP